MKRPVQRKASIIILPVLLAGCGGAGRVNQGQVVEYERSKGLITVVQDSNYRDPSAPRFDVLPPVTIRTPKDPREMGPEPEAGRLLLIDCAHRRAVIFAPATQSLRSVAFELVSEQNGVLPSDSRVRATHFPRVDRATRTITVYSPHDRRLVAFIVAPQDVDLPEESWRFGDEIRYYYKDPGRALRLMNVSKTDLNKVGK